MEFYQGWKYYYENSIQNLHQAEFQASGMPSLFSDDIFALPRVDIVNYTIKKKLYPRLYANIVEFNPNNMV